jgi:hypothetical protein
MSARFQSKAHAPLPPIRVEIKEDVMGWFRREQNKTVEEPREGVPIDPERYLMEVSEGIRPGLPHDGRYWGMMAETHPDNETRLQWEEAATYEQAKGWLKSLQDISETRPRRLNKLNIDDITGAWAARLPGRVFGVLTVWHPSMIGVDRSVRRIREASGLDPDGKNFLVDSDFGHDTLDWAADKSTHIVRYSTLLREALLGVAMYREAPDLLTDLGIDRRSKSIDDADRLVNVMEDELRRLASRIEPLAQCSLVPPELLDLHIKSVEFFGVVRKVHELNCESLKQSFVGNRDEKGRLNADAENYIPRVKQALSILAAELRRIKETDHQLYSALDIPRDILESLNPG